MQVERQLHEQIKMAKHKKIKKELITTHQLKKDNIKVINKTLPKNKKTCQNFEFLWSILCSFSNKVWYTFFQICCHSLFKMQIQDSQI